MKEQLDDLPRGNLQGDETHPMIPWAARLISLVLKDPVATMNLRGALATTAIEGNRLAEILIETIDRVKGNKPVGERYILGLGLFLATRGMLGRENTRLAEQNLRVNLEAQLEADVFDHYEES